jgi:hypothetical protein
LSDGLCGLCDLDGWTWRASGHVPSGTRAESEENNEDE